MIKHFLLYCFIFINCFCVTAQNNREEIFSGCGTNLALQQNPDLKTAQDYLNSRAYQYLVSSRQNLRSQKTMVQYVPVVVHIIHNNGPENISNLQVQTAISNINSMFLASDSTQIQFCLAQRDPNGNPTDGITRDVSALTNETMETDDIALKNINRWSPTCYLNIWIVSEINSLSMGPGVIGYAYFPSSHGMPMDGVVIEAAYFGSSVTNDAVGTHELGHYLGLYHTFENACSNNNCMLEGDMVCDTPPDQTTFSSCAPNANSCSTDTDDPSSNNPFSADVPDLGNDYMDYSNLSCYNLFTPGQYARMNYFLNNVRSSLMQCLSCSSPCPTPVTANIILPASSPVTVTTGTSVNFQGTYTNATGQQWYLNPGSILSTASVYTHTFASQGSFWMKYRAISSDPSLCLDALDSIQIIVTEPVSTSCEGSLDLTNTNSSVHLPLTNEIYSSNGFTWECWVKLTDPFGTSFRPMICAIDGVVYEDMTLSFGWTGGIGNVPVTSLAFKVDGPAGPSSSTCNYAPPGGFILGTWYHVAGTMNYMTQTGKLYLNGTLVDTKTISSTPFSRIIPAQLSWDVALNPAYPGPPLGGNLDEVRIWKKVRTDSEIAADYDQCLSGNETDLLIYYRANQNAGTSCLDATPNMYHGTLSSTALWSTQQASIITTNCAYLCNSFCPPILACSDTIICDGDSVQLNVSGSYGSYSWSPATGLSNAAIPDPIANPAVTTTYTVTGVNVDSNLFVNPTFVLGNYGFSSGQTYSSLYSPCNYYVAPTFFTGYPALTDHTPTSDNYYMSVDGCTSGPTVLWEQLVPVITANTDYEFAFWASRADAVQPDFEIHAIGNVTGDITLATQAGIPYTTTWTWDQYGVPLWNSGPNTSVTFKIINTETNGFGNDFGLDDFSLRRICTSSDTVTVSIGSYSFSLDLGNDTALCGSGVIVLDAGSGFQQYTWQDGSHGETFTAFGPGMYWVTVIDPCAGILTDTISITSSPSPGLNIINDTAICGGDSLQLGFTGSTTFSSFNWAPVTYLDCSSCEQPVSRPLGSIQYFLVASTSQGCTVIDSIEITVFPDPSDALQVTTSDETCGNGDGSIQLSITDNSAAPYLFNFDNSGYSSSTTYANIVSGYYNIEIKDNNNCVYDTAVQISGSGIMDTLNIPNCFSPNNDGINDTWFITAVCGEKISCKILNRWGIEIATIHEDEFWNGKISGVENAVDGVYYYIAEIEYVSGVKKKLTGFISLLR
jgi:gliding motility-associated-like protein